MADYDSSYIPSAAIHSLQLVPCFLQEKISGSEITVLYTEPSSQNNFDIFIICLRVAVVVVVFQTEGEYRPFSSPDKPSIRGPDYGRST